jgi:O-methyltransferase involved in polyketide biosynthesis
MAADAPRLSVSLDGVPETTLWTLYFRAKEARRKNGPLQDPRAIELVDAIDFPFATRFGNGVPAFGRMIGLRALTFDLIVNDVLRTDPDALVVVLGEGLETQFWRVDNGRVRWFTVDLPETAEIRRRLLGEDPPRRRLFAGSALDEGWWAALGAQPTDRVVVIAQGLLMYLQPAQVRGLIARCAREFPGGVMAFDTVPRWFSLMMSSGRAKGPGGYVAPPMPWGVDVNRLASRLRKEPGIADARVVEPHAPDLPIRGALLAARLLPPLRGLGPAVLRLDFAGKTQPPASGPGVANQS